MDKNSSKFTILFATGVCVVLAVLLASTYNGLLDRIKANEEFDRQTNILIALGLYDKVADADKSRKDLEDLFENRVRSKILKIVYGPVTREVMRRGDVIEETVPGVVRIEETDHDISELAQLERELQPQTDADYEYAPLYVSIDADDEPLAYSIPISGRGLWSTLRGYLALQKDLDHVQGITFYSHKETPGLGGEVDNPNWQAQWRSKRVRNDKGELVSVTVKKGKVVESEAGAVHKVDGLSGATITSNGVTKFVRADLEKYEVYFQELRGK